MTIAIIIIIIKLRKENVTILHYVITSPLFKLVISLKRMK